MKTASRLLVLAAVLIAAAAPIGCGDQGKDDDKAAYDQFRIPDSLLAPIERFDIVRDEYHPIRGGIIADNDVELHYPASEIARFIAVRGFELSADGYQKVVKEIGKPAEDKLVIIGTQDLEEYQYLTRKEWWYYGVNEGDTIIFEPIDIMLKRNIAPISITQKIAQAALDRRSGGRIPIWLKEAIASGVSGERGILENQVEEFRYEGAELNYPPAEVEKALREAVDRQATRIAYWAAYLMYENLLEMYTMDEIMGFIDILGGGGSLDDASIEVFGLRYDEIIEKIRIDGRPVEKDDGEYQKS